MKVAIVGSAPSSAHLAPYDDPEWTVWACSPGAVPAVRRVDEWFEIHRWSDWGLPEYVKFLALLGKPVHMIRPVPEIPTSVAYPKDEMIERFGPEFFTSTPAWMLALAIAREADEIGIFGIDMASDAEYATQKAGCLYFIGQARAAGIKVTVPPQSDLLRPPPLYGFDEDNPMSIKLASRQSELLARIANCDAQIEHFTREKLFLKGAEENLRYVINTWVQ